MDEEVGVVRGLWFNPHGRLFVLSPILIDGSFPFLAILYQLTTELEPNPGIRSVLFKELRDALRIRVDRPLAIIGDALEG